MDALAYVLQLLNALPQLIQAGHDVTDLITETRERLKDMQAGNRPPSPGEWDDLNARIDTLRGKLHSDDT